MLEHRAEVDDLRQAHARKRAAFVGRAIRLDAAYADADGNPLESPYLGDGGRGARAIRAAGEREPWLEEFERVLATLTPVERRVVEAFDQDPRPAVVARRVNLHRQQVYRIMEKLRRRFNRCYTLHRFCDR